MNILYNFQLRKLYISDLFYHITKSNDTQPIRLSMHHIKQMFLSYSMNVNMIIPHVNYMHPINKMKPFKHDEFGLLHSSIIIYPQYLSTLLKLILRQYDHMI